MKRHFRPLRLFKDEKGYFLITIKNKKKIRINLKLKKGLKEKNVIKYLIKNKKIHSKPIKKNKFINLFSTKSITPLFSAQIHPEQTIAQVPSSFGHVRGHVDTGFELIPKYNEQITKETSKETSKNQFQIEDLKKEVDDELKNIEEEALKREEERIKKLAEGRENKFENKLVDEEAVPFEEEENILMEDMSNEMLKEVDSLIEESKKILNNEETDLINTLREIYQKNKSTFSKLTLNDFYLYIDALQKLYEINIDMDYYKGKTNLVMKKNKLIDDYPNLPIRTLNPIITTEFYNLLKKYPLEERESFISSAIKPKRYAGKGKFTNYGKGLYDDEIVKILKKKLHRMVPVIMSDEIPTLAPFVNKNTNQFGFVINKENSNQPGIHWRACFLDFDKCNIDYYDSLVSEPNKQFLEDIQLLVNKRAPNCYMKLRVNQIKDQADDTNNCGFFAAKFISDEFNGIPYKYKKIIHNEEKGEKEIEKFKDHIFL